MRTIGRLSLLFVVYTFLFSLTSPATVAATGDSCALPLGLRDVIAKKYSDRRVLKLSDLSDYDKKLYKKDHGIRCPGLARVNFYGDQKPTWAVVLLSGTDPKAKAILIVARQLDKDWDIRILESADEYAVVWRERGGKYEDVYEQESISAPHSVVVFCHYSSWAILYAWTGKDVKKIWLSD